MGSSFFRSIVHRHWILSLVASSSSPLLFSIFPLARCAKQIGPLPYFFEKKEIFTDGGIFDTKNQDLALTDS